MSLIKSVGAGEQSTGFYSHLLDQSLKFNDGDSQYLTRTPASAGNRRTWTFSAWIKLGSLTQGERGTIFQSSGGPTIYQDSGLRFAHAWDPAGTDYIRETVGLFRDTAWYHVVWWCDTTQAGTRWKIYVNGTEQTLQTPSGYNGEPAQNTDLGINSTNAHTIGVFAASSYFDGYMAEINFIDGTALTADSFGETKDGIWIPKDTSGLTFGTNGFHLTFKDDVVSEGFNAVTYTGTGAAQSISGIGFDPNFVWIKQRSGSTRSNRLNDSVRGANKQLYSDLTNAEGTSTTELTSFDSDGFSLGSASGINNSGDTYVAWCWEAGGTPTADNSAGAGATPTAGSVKIDGSNLGSALAGTIAATRLSANTARGFSIVSYTGNGTHGTIAHGLSSAPTWIIVKDRSTAENWAVWHSGIAITKYLRLNAINAAATPSRKRWNDTSPTSTVFSVGDASDQGDREVNQNNENYIAYCWTDISGYSKFGTYTGNGSSTGPTFTTGFKPSMVIIKRTDATNNWIIQDTTRDPANPVDAHLYLNLSNTEDTGKGFDVSDTGFQIKTNGDGWNASGGTYIYMAFADTREAAFFKDVTTNGNHFTPVNLDYRDSVPDVPTNSFATLNPLDNISTTYSEGNLQYAQSNYNYNSRGTMAVTSGKWYWEIHMNGTHGEFGVCENGKAGQSDPQANIGFYFIYNNGSAGVSYKNATAGSQSTGSISMTNWSAGDICQIAYDADNGILYHGLNGTYQTSGDPAAGSGGLITGISPQFGGTMVPFFGSGTSSSRTWVVNFGQDSSFAGLVATANSNADGNGHGSFAYAPPSGFLALCSQNLPDVDIIDGTDYFNTILWTGDGSQTRSLTGVNFQPNFSWLKIRSGTTQDHQLYDSVRGAGSGKNLSSNTTAVEGTVNSYSDGDYGFVSSFDADGFSVDDGAVATTGGYVNYSGRTYVAWNWLAGTAFSNDASATSVGTIDSEGQVNTTAGFSIIKYTGSGSNATVAHGLGVAPSMVIIKSRVATSADGNWLVYVKAGSVDETDYLLLNSTGAATDEAGAFNDTAATTTTFSVGTFADLNQSSKTYIAYCFADVEGYSKVGSYVGNSSADGTFVHTGFRPAWILIKRTTDGTYHWRIYDSKRSPFNEVDDYLSANLNFAEATGLEIDFLSNGFKIRTSNDDINDASKNYIYLAFAESPFKFANAR